MQQRICIAPAMGAANMEAQMLLKELQNLANADDARAMKACMRGRFEFLGVKTPANYEIGRASCRERV